MSEQKRVLIIGGDAAIGGCVVKALGIYKEIEKLGIETIVHDNGRLNIGMLTENMDPSDVIILNDNLSGLNSLKELKKQFPSEPPLLHSNEPILIKKAPEITYPEYEVLYNPNKGSKARKKWYNSKAVDFKKQKRKKKAALKARKRNRN